jgi:hypothetical protein
MKILQNYTMPFTACGTHCCYLAVRFISFTHLCVGIPDVLLSGFQTKIVYAFHILSVCALYPNHFILHDLVT